MLSSNSASRVVLLLAVGLAAGCSVDTDAAEPSNNGAPISVGPGTHVLNHPALLDAASVTGDKSWYEANIPFLDIPDAQVQNVYYYRFLTWKEHLNYLDIANGYTSSEFVDNPFYAASGGAVDAAAGHVIHDGRWVRDGRYLDDYEAYWMTGPGVGHTHGAYTFWAASSYYDRFLVNGDATFLRDYQQKLVEQWDGWSNQFDAGLGLYWTFPDSDAMEYDAASYETSDHYKGGAGFRSSINVYQWADALAIAKIAQMNGDTGTAQDFTNRAAALKANMQSKLWDAGRSFFYHMQRDNNPGRALLDTREIYGFFPWYFGMPDPAYSSAWAQIKDPQGFAATYGPTTTERRSNRFMVEALNGCCRWDGPSWPYATSFVVGGIARLLTDYPAQSYVTRADFMALLHTFAITQYKNGKPYVAEAHHPDEDRWIYDAPGHSLDYNHSSYTDLVISYLIGLRPQPDTTVVIDPLVPDSWDHFALENVAYHGHNVTVLYDRDGKHYGQGSGFKVFVDGTSKLSQANVGKVKVDVGATVVSPKEATVNIAANVAKAPFGTQPFASYTSNYDTTWNAVDGRKTYLDGVNTRWTSYQSTNPSDSFGVNFGHITSVDAVRLFFYDDGGGVRVPQSYDLQSWNGSTWVTVPNQKRSPAAPEGNAINEVTFPALTTNQLRVVAPNRGGGVGWGLSELEVWAKPTLFIVNKNSGLMLAVNNGSLNDSALVQQYHDSNTRDHLWTLMPAGGGLYKIKNLNSNLLLGVDGMSTANSAKAVQFHDNGTADHLWQLISMGDGWFKIKNKNSGRFLGVDGMSTADSANVVQFDDNGSADHFWRLQPSN